MFDELSSQDWVRLPSWCHRAVLGIARAKVPGDRSILPLRPWASHQDTLIAFKPPWDSWQTWPSRYLAKNGRTVAEPIEVPRIHWNYKKIQGQSSKCHARSWRTVGRRANTVLIRPWFLGTASSSSSGRTPRTGEEEHGIKKKKECKHSLWKDLDVTNVPLGQKLVLFEAHVWSRTWPSTSPWTPPRWKLPWRPAPTLLSGLTEWEAIPNSGFSQSSARLVYSI